MRALITFAFVLFLVASVPLFAFSGWLGPVMLLVWLPFALPFLGAVAVVWLPNDRAKFLPSDIFFPPPRRYKSWNSIHGWPRGDDLSYECLNCHKALRSNGTEPKECACGNLFVGPDHIGASEPGKVRLFEE